jgi:hypothetical protein
MAVIVTLRAASAGSARQSQLSVSGAVKHRDRFGAER